MKTQNPPKKSNIPLITELFLQQSAELNSRIDALVEKYGTKQDNKTETQKSQLMLG